MQWQSTVNLLQILHYFCISDKFIKNTKMKEDDSGDTNRARSIKIRSGRSFRDRYGTSRSTERRLFQ